MITGKISLIKNKEKEIAFPVTSAEAVYMPDGKTTVNEQLETIATYKKSVNILEIGAKSSNVIFNELTNKYDMFDISDYLKLALEKGYNDIILPSGNYLVENTIRIYNGITIRGYNATIYSSPSTTVKTLFALKGSNNKIEGIKFDSVKKYKTTIQATDSTAISSNICAIAIEGEGDKSYNNLIQNCSASNVCYFASIMNTSNAYINNCNVDESYFPIYTGFGAENIYIDKCILSTQEDTDKYGHNLYIAHLSNNINVSDCKLINNGQESSNIIKCGSNEGGATNININNCEITGKVKYSLFYVHADTDLNLNNCSINIDSVGGYSRIFQFGNNSTFLAKNSDFTLNGFDRFTIGYNFTNSTIKFLNTSFIIKNSVETYSRLPLVSGADLIFENCLLDYSKTNRGGNFMDQNMKSVELYNCKLLLHVDTNIGLWSGDNITYTKTTSPKCVIVNTVIEKKENTKNIPFFGFIKNSNYTPFVLFSNITTINCEAKGGSRVGEITYLNAETDYNLYNNIINVVIS